jgi:predicted Zn-dependent protease
MTSFLPVFSKFEGQSYATFLLIQRKMNPLRLAQLKALMATDPDDPFLPYAIAQEHTAAGLWEEACIEFEGLVERFPDYLPTYYQYGVALFKLDRLAQAIVILQLGLGLARRYKDMKTAGEIEGLLEDLD